MRTTHLCLKIHSILEIYCCEISMGKSTMHRKKNIKYSTILSPIVDVTTSSGSLGKSSSFGRSFAWKVVDSYHISLQTHCCNISKHQTDVRPEENSIGCSAWRGSQMFNCGCFRPCANHVNIWKINHSINVILSNKMVEPLLQLSSSREIENSKSQ